MRVCCTGVGVSGYHAAVVCKKVHVARPSEADVAGHGSACTPPFDKTFADDAGVAAAAEEGSDMAAAAAERASAAEVEVAREPAVLPET